MVEKVPRFPDKKNTKRRRRRVVGKYGSWLIERPTMMMIGRQVVCQPRHFDELRRMTRQVEGSFYP